MRDIIFDIDDISEKTDLSLLYELKKIIPELKVTLFTILANSSIDFLKELSSKDWIELALHGYNHQYKECLKWDIEKTNKVLIQAESTGCFVKGFRAPYWAIKQEVHQVLKERGWWVADQPYNKTIRPNGCLIYELGVNSVHGHIQNVCGNGLQEKFDYYKSLKGRFHFINFVIRSKIKFKSGG